MSIFKAMINFAKNDEFLTIIITVPFIRKIQNFVDAVEDKFLMNTLVDRLKNNSHLIILKI